MHGKLLVVVFLIHNILLMLISAGYLTSLLLFQRPHAGIDHRYSRVERDGMIWSNVVAIAIALGNFVLGCVAIRKEKLACFYVYMALCVVNIGAPIALSKLIRVQFVAEDYNRDEGATKAETSLDEEAETLITVVNAFACTFFGSNFICFYNAFLMKETLQFARGKKISRSVRSDKSKNKTDKSTVHEECATARKNQEAESRTEDSSPAVQFAKNADSSDASSTVTVKFNVNRGQLKN